MFTLLLYQLFLVAVLIGIALLISAIWQFATEKEKKKTPGATRRASSKALRAILEVGPQGSVLRVGDKQVSLQGTGPQVLGEAGQYLTPGAQLEVRGVPKDEVWLAAASVLTALGVQVSFGE